MTQKSSKMVQKWVKKRNGRFLGENGNLTKYPLFTFYRKILGLYDLFFAVLAQIQIIEKMPLFDPKLTKKSIRIKNCFLIKKNSKFYKKNEKFVKKMKKFIKNCVFFVKNSKIVKNCKNSKKV